MAHGIAGFPSLRALCATLILLGLAGVPVESAAQGVRAGARVKVAEPSGPPKSICEAAGAARDRNSPAAPGLAAQCLATGGKLPARAADPAAGATESTTAIEAARVSRVPNVVGMSLTEAEGTLRLAGFEPTLNFLQEPDPDVRLGHVRATDPRAGTVAGGGKVELQIPRAASRMGIGALSPADIRRRMGFDLDEGRYEEVLRGADIILEREENTPHTDSRDGVTVYTGAGWYIKPSDGAVLVPIRDFLDVTGVGLGSYYSYLQCEVSLKQPRAPKIKISNPPTGYATFCVVTAKGQLLILQFRQPDNEDNPPTNFKFYHGLFPRQLTSRPADPLQLKR